MSRRRLLIAIVAAVVVVAGAAFVGRGIVSSPSPSPAPPHEGATVPQSQDKTQADPHATPPGYVRFRDSRAGFSIAYPRTWSRVASSDPAVELLVAQGRTASLLVRRAPVGLDVTEKTLPIARRLTDSLVRADGRVRLLGRPQALIVDGLPGYVYEYTFAASSGERGAHIHYFLFKGGQLITLVFQVLPADRLKRVLPVFQRIAATFSGRVA